MTGPREASPSSQEDVRDPPGRLDRSTLLGASARVFALCLALRIAFAAGLAVAAPSGLAWFPEQYDCPAYMAIANSFPLFQSTPELIATARWYPLAPFFVWIVGLVTSIDLAAVAVPLVASSLAVALLYTVARQCDVPRPGLVATWFALLPPKWFLLSVFPMSEPVYLALLLGAVLATLRGRFRTFLVLLALVTLVKPTSVLFVGVFALHFAWRREFTRAAWTLSCGLPPLLLQVYLSLFHGFDQFPVLVHAQAGVQAVEYSTPTGQVLSYPLHAMLEGLTNDTIPLSFRLVTLAEFLVYTGGLYLAFRLRNANPGLRLAFLWLGTLYAFQLCVYGSIHLAGFRGFTRLMIPAAPAVLLVLATGARPLWDRAVLRVGSVVLGALYTAAIVVATLRIHLD